MLRPMNRDDFSTINLLRTLDHEPELAQSRSAVAESSRYSDNESITGLEPEFHSSSDTVIKRQALVVNPIGVIERGSNRSRTVQIVQNIERLKRLERFEILAAGSPSRLVDRCPSLLRNPGSIRSRVPCQQQVRMTGACTNGYPVESLAVLCSMTWCGRILRRTRRCPPARRRRTAKEGSKAYAGQWRR